MNGLFLAAVVGMVLVGDGAIRNERSRRVGRRVVRRLRPNDPDPRPVPRVVAEALDRAGLPDARRLLDRWMAVAAGAVVAAPFVPGGVIFALVTVIGPPVAVIARRGHRAKAVADALPLALDSMAASLRGGSSLTAALGTAANDTGPLRDEFSRIHDHTTRGRALTAVMGEWADAADASPDRRLAGAAIALCAEVGGSGALALDAAAASLRDRHGADAEIDALSVQARLSALLLTLTPIGFAFLLSTLDPASARFLFTTPLGWICIGCGLGLDALGALWMRRIVGAAR